MSAPDVVAGAMVAAATMSDRPQGAADAVRRAGELAGARRLPEAELELTKALSVAPRDLPALKLLAFVRFRLGRVADAREAYKAALAIAPDDAAVRLNLGLLALKLAWFEEAAVELEAATRLRVDDTRAWSYLGYAWARIGEIPKSAQAFRRAGQDAIAAEIEGGQPVPPPAAAVDPPVERSATPALASVSDRRLPSCAVMAVTDFAVERLLPSRDGAAGGVARFAVDDEAHVRRSSLLASMGALTSAPAWRRKRGRVSDEPLGTAADPFLRCTGAGTLWLAPPVGRNVVVLTFDQDILYVREQRVLAFDSAVVWEGGAVPWDPSPLLQFRGTGRVALDAGGDELVALRVGDEAITVPHDRLLGWIGRIVAHSVREPGESGKAAALPRIACEGEGVLLLCRHGDSAQPVHEHTEPGHDGTGPADPGRPRLHR